MTKQVLLTHNGKTQTQRQWAKELNLSEQLICQRRKRGLTIEKCLSHDMDKPPVLLTYQGKTQTQSEWARELDLYESCISKRLKKGLPVDLCLSKDRVITSNGRAIKKNNVAKATAKQKELRELILPEVLKLSDEQLEFINGNLLGDASIFKPNGNASFSFAQKLDNKEYVELTKQRYLPFTQLKITERKTKAPSRVNGKITHDPVYWNGKYLSRCEFISRRHAEFTKLYNKWYPNGKKIVPKDLKLTWKTLATWYCDDGCNSISKVRNSTQQQLVLCTNAFSLEDAIFLIDRFKEDLNLQVKVGYKDLQPILIIRNQGTQQIKTFLEGIAPYMPQCMAYKMVLMIPKVVSFHPNSGITRMKNARLRPWFVRGSREILGYFATESEAIECRKTWEFEHPNRPAEFVNVMDLILR